MLACLWLVLVPAALTAAAEAQAKRLALVIGNEDYPSQPGNLNNPHEDVARIADALESVGFVVTRRFDRNQGEIVDDVGALGEALVKAGPEAIGFFYYSGHGASAEVNGKRRNYIMPAKTTITSGQQLALRGVPLDQLLDGLSVANAKAVFFVSDACRNTLPWSDEKGGEESKAFNAVARRSGLYVAFAAADGQTTPDDGYFSDQLSHFIKQPGQTADRVFTLALREVAKRRPGEKLPFIADGLTSDVCFAACAPGPLTMQPNQTVVSAAGTALPPVNPEKTNVDVELARQRAAQLLELEKTDLDQAIAADNSPALNKFLTLHPGSVYTTQIRTLLGQCRMHAVAVEERQTIEWSEVLKYTLGDHVGPDTTAEINDRARARLQNFCNGISKKHKIPLAKIGCGAELGKTTSWVTATPNNDCKDVLFSYDENCSETLHETVFYLVPKTEEREQCHE